MSRMYVRYQVTLVSDGRWKQRGCANISLVFLRLLLVGHQVQQPETVEEASGFRNPVAIRAPFRFRIPKEKFLTLHALIFAAATEKSGTLTVHG